MTAHFLVGIDPGPVNTGLALLDTDLNLVHSETLDFSGLTPLQVLRRVRDIIPGEIHRLTVERFVSYRGHLTDSAERTCILVGALSTLVETPVLVRAIDWKNKVAQQMYLRGYRNPSQSKDKVFSLSAAEYLTGKKFKTDHEADATLLAFYGNLT